MADFYNTPTPITRKIDLLLEQLRTERGEAPEMVTTYGVRLCPTERMGEIYSAQIAHVKAQGFASCYDVMAKFSLSYTESVRVVAALESLGVVEDLSHYANSHLET